MERHKFFWFGLLFLVLLAGSFFAIRFVTPKANLGIENNLTQLGVRPIAKLEGNSNQTATLIFVGDIMLSRAVGKLMVKKNNWHYPFLKIGDYLGTADLTFGNLESLISAGGTNIGSIYSFRADPKSAESLSYYGFDILSLANNHIWDYGAEAFKDTLKILTDTGISYVGAGPSYEEAHEPVVREVKGNKIAFLAYTNLLPTFLGRKDAKQAVAFMDEPQMILDIQKAKTFADIVVVSFHWGEEYQTQHNDSQERVAHLAIDAGANLIVGHHPHVVQEVEKYHGGYIAYSLGNFVFDQNFSKDTRNGLVLTVFVKNGKIESLKQQKIEFSPTFQPFLSLIK